MIDIKRTPVTGPSVWEGADMQQRHDWIMHWTERELSQIDQALQDVKHRGIAKFDIRKADFPLPDFSTRAADIAERVENGCGFVVMRGFPVERYSKEEAEIAYWGLGTHVGQGVSQNAQGDLITHVTDRGLQFGAKEVRGYQTQSDLFFHNDHGDVVVLLFLGVAKQGGTSQLVSTGMLYNDILEHHPEYIDELCRGYHYHMRGEHQRDAPEVTEHRVPVFSWFAGLMSSRLAKNAILIGEEHVGHALSARERAPLDYIDQACARHCMSMRMELGDMQFVSNYSVLHARTSFVDFDDPAKKRHLLRLWLNLEHSRPLTHEFATRYGPGSARLGVPRVAGA